MSRVCTLPPGHQKEGGGHACRSFVSRNPTTAFMVARHCSSKKSFFLSNLRIQCIIQRMVFLAGLRLGRARSPYLSLTSSLHGFLQTPPPSSIHAWQQLTLYSMLHPFPSFPASTLLVYSFFGGFSNPSDSILNTIFT